MAIFDHLTRRRLLGLAGITVASLSLPRLGVAADEHAGHNTAQEPAGTGEFIRLDAPRKLKLAVNLNAVCLAPVVIDTQQNLLDAAVAEGVARFIHSS